MTGQVALGVVALVRVGAAPLKPAGGQLVGGQRAGPRSEAEIIKINPVSFPHHQDIPACNDDCLLSVPGAVF